MKYALGKSKYALGKPKCGLGKPEYALGKIKCALGKVEYVFGEVGYCLGLAEVPLIGNLLDLGSISNTYRMKTVFDKGFSIQPSDFEFEYQKELTEQLDRYEGEFNQELINEIVLWKVNRYVLVNTEVIELLNEIDTNLTEIDEQRTRKILEQLLSTKGIQLAMASTLLRFRNPHIYQIIDQRVFRVIYPNKTFKTSYTKSASNISNQIKLYMDYLKDLRIVSHRLDIPFNLADRILFEVDKRLNKGERLNNYGYGGSKN